MPLVRRHSPVNPRLGIYASIVASVLASLVLFLLVIEELGSADRGLGLGTWLGIGLTGLFLAIAIATASSSAHDYFAAGRRVPAGFNGLVLAVALIGGTGVVSLTGTLFLAGFDALAIPIGFATGLVLMAVLLVPFFRKLGAMTVPSFLSMRFQSPVLGIATASLLAVPLLLLLVAELRIGAEAAALLTGRSTEATTVALCLAILVIVGASGQRSATWTGVALALAALLALVLPVTIVATIETFLPLPQLSHGPILRALARTEAMQAVPQIQLPPLAMTLPGNELTILAGRFGSPMTSLGSWAFCLLSLVVAFGVAGSPSLLLRAGTTPSVYESRKSLGWAAFVLMIVVTTISAIAVLTRDVVLKQAIGSDPARLVDWLKDWVGLGLAGVDPSGGRIGVNSLAFRRDGILYLLAHAHGLPHVVVATAVAGAMAAALLAALQTALALSASLADDIVLGSRLVIGADRRRLLLARGALGVTLIVAVAIATRLPADPLQLVLWSLGLTAATAFPVLVLSIWWKSISSRGALAGALAGFALTAVGMLLSEAGILGLASPLAAVLGVPVAFAAAVAVSLISAAPSRAELELIRDVRVPSGETYIDREVRHGRTLGRRS